MGIRYRFLLSTAVMPAAILAASMAAPAAGHAQAITSAQRAQLEQELRQVEAEQVQAERQLATARSHSASLSQAIAVLEAKIRAETLDIKAKNILIQTLGGEITDKQSHINDLESQIAAGKQSLAALLRRMNEVDAYSLPQVLLSQTSVSGFFGDLDSMQSLQAGLQDAFDRLQADEASTSAEKDALSARQNAEMDARHSIEVEQSSVQSDEREQRRLLVISQNNEETYSQYAAEKQAEAAKIRAELFSLNGAKAIPFGDAYDYATAVYKATGVPQNFLLAIMTQESNLGKNMGTCYLTDTGSGSGVNAVDGSAVSYVMKPSRDVRPFLDITSALGLDYKSMPVSCPQSVGWGGAMGPAQFIASTWQLFQDRIDSALGRSGEPDPWNPMDAFMASGLYLADLGAGSGGYSAERNAACKYYSGQPCGYVYGSSGYGNSVMALADSIQENQINPMQGL